MKSMEHASSSFTVCKCGDHMGIGANGPKTLAIQARRAPVS